MPSESTASPQLSESERQLLLEQVLERQEKLAESGLEMARMFVERGSPEIARRRLEKLIAEYPAATVNPGSRATPGENWDDPRRLVAISVGHGLP